MNRHPRVLIVDDVPENVMLLGRALGSGYDVQFATSGDEALQRVRHHLPDLVLLDVLMPGIDGLQVLQELRSSEASQAIPVILVSGDTSEQRQLDGLLKGADDYIFKPVVASVLQVRVRNLLQRHQVARQLRLADHVFRHCGEAIMVTDSDNQIIEVNPAFSRVTGYSVSEVRGRDPRMLASGHTSPEQYRQMWQALRDDGFWQGEIWDRHRDGYSYPKLLTISVVRNQRGGIDYHIATFTDISARKAAEERLEFLAQHDPLTGLPNRLLLNFTVEQQLAHARHEGSRLALLVLDLDHFKRINDTQGHPVGDQLLVAVAGRLTETVRSSDLVARLGGDEFVLLLKEAGPAQAAVVAAKLIEVLAQPFVLDEQRLQVSASIGICLFPDDCDSSEALFANADLALYDAKAAGRDGYCFYRAELNQVVSRRYLLAARLRNAAEQQALALAYQPVFDQAGQLQGVEALLRWTDDELGVVEPAEFIAVAEQGCMLPALGYWVLDEACRQLRQWRDAGLTVPLVSVNLAASQLRDPALPAQLVATLARHRLAGSDLLLEISEASLLQEALAVSSLMSALAGRGVRLAIDNFGTAASALPQWLRLPLAWVKIDRTLVADLGHADARQLCRSAIALGHSLDLLVVAEGVETAAQRELLQQAGCDLLQGHLLGRPQLASQMPLWSQPA